MKNIIGYLFSIISRTRLWIWLSKNHLAHLTFRIRDYTEFPMECYNEIILKMGEAKADNPNLVFAWVLNDPKSVAGWIINRLGFKWSHSGFIDPTNRFFTLHMKASGAKRQYLLSLLRECDYFALYAFEVKSTELHAERLKWDVISKYEYDFQQEIDSDALLYCSELIYFVLQGNTIGELRPHEDYGRLVFSPDDVAKYGQLIYSNRS